MAETRPVIGLKWEPKLPSFSDLTKPSSSSSASASGTIRSNDLFMPSSRIIDGLYVPTKNPRNLHKLLHKQIEETTGLTCLLLLSPRS